MGYMFELVNRRRINVAWLHLIVKNMPVHHTHTEITSGCSYLVSRRHYDSSKLQQKMANLVKKTSHIAARDNDVKDVIKFMRQRLFKLLLSVIPIY